MRNLLRLIQRFHLTFVFLLLEVVALLLLVNHNNYQRTRFYNSGNVVVGSIYKETSRLNDYINLKKINLDLAEENVMLKNLLLHNVSPSSDSVISFSDSLISDNFKFIQTRVINISVNRLRNYITLNKGTLDGLKPEMGVIAPRGVVGKIIQCSNNYSVVIPIINPQLRISTKIEKNGAFGSLVWDGYDAGLAHLEEIPYHVDLQVGDKLITSGYSGTFPEGIMVGHVKEVKRITGENFYDILVDLSVDFNNISLVEAIENTTRKELENIQNSTLTND